jgi:hypothetical protein
MCVNSLTVIIETRMKYVNALGEYSQMRKFLHSTLASLASQRTNILATFASLENVASTLLAKVHTSARD